MVCTPVVPVPASMGSGKARTCERVGVNVVCFGVYECYMLNEEGDDVWCVCVG